MKKNLLLATSAVVAAGFFASEAAAQIEVTVGGEIRFQAGYVFSESESLQGTRGMAGSQVLGRSAPGTEQSDIDALTSAQLAGAFGVTDADRAGSFGIRGNNIRFTVSNTADNGLSYGGEYRFAGGGERARTWLRGAFGTVRLGEWDTAAQQLRVRVPFSGRDRFGGDIDNYIFNAGIAGDGTVANGGAKITYLTTGTALDDMGITLGLSYTPNSTAGTGGGTGIVSRTNTNFNDVGTVAFEFDDEFNGVGVSFGAGYEFGNASNSSTVGDGPLVNYFVDNGGAGNVVRSDRNLSAFNVGAGVGFGGFDVGVHYIDRGASGNISGFEDRTWAAGARYSVGPWNFGVSYADGRQNVSVTGTDANNNATRATYTVNEQRLGLGTTFRVAEGLVLAGDLGYNQSEWKTTGDNNAGNNLSLKNESWVGLVTTRLTF